MPRLRRLEQPRRDGRPRHAPGVAPRPIAAADWRRDAGGADRHRGVRRAAPGDRHRRARPGPGRRPRAGLAGAASVANRGSASPRSSSRPPPGLRSPASSTPRARSRRPRSGSAPAGSACSTCRPGAAIEVLAEHDVGRIVEVGRSMRPALRRRRLDPDGHGRRARRRGRQRRPGPRGHAPADGVRQGRVDRGRARRARDEGRLDRRTEDHGAPRRRGDRARGRAVRRAAPGARLEEPLRLDRRGRRLRDGRGGPDRGRAIRPARSSPSTPSRPPGSVVAPTLEGSRPLLVEVQALVAPAGYGTPGPQGERHRPEPARPAGRGPRPAGRASALGSHDVYANLAGGLTVGEPGLDLPLALALASSLRDRPLAAKSVAIGEVGLLGELRSVAGLERRLREAARLGFESAIVPRPARGAARSRSAGMRIVEVATLREAVEAALGRSSPGVVAMPSRRC